MKTIHVYFELSPTTVNQFYTPRTLPNFLTKGKEEVKAGQSALEHHSHINHPMRDSGASLNLSQHVSQGSLPCSLSA